MSDTDETLEALQMRLMKRQRQVADFEAKMKKTQFKHSRDIKEAKIAQERAKTYLKQQKAKVDRLSKSAKQKQEQNNLLTKRLQELRQQKQREVLELRNQYNLLKDQVRSYERILPTLTFLNQLDLRIGSIPTYQEIFLNLKSKIQELNQLEKKYKDYQNKSQQTTKTLRQNEEMARRSKQQIDRKLKQILSKVADYELQVSESKTMNDDLVQANEQLKEEVSMWTERAEGLQSAVREHQLKLEELDRAYSYELMSKQQEVRSLTQQQFDKYEEEIRSLEHRLEIKDKMYLQQVNILEQEVYFLQSRIAEQKEHFQQNYILIKQQIQRMREEVEKERFQHEELKGKYSDLQEKNKNMNKTKELLELKIASLDKKVEQMKENEKNRAQSFSDVQMSQFENLQEKYAQLRQQHELVNSRISHFQQQNKQLQEQVSMLKNELMQKNTPNLHTLEVPTNFFQFQVEGRKSIEGDSRNSIEIQEIVLDRIKSGQKVKVQQPKTDRQSKDEESINSIKKERDQLKVQVLQLKQQISELSSNLAQKEQSVLTITKNYNLLKSKAESQTQQISLLNEQHKREKQNNIKLRQQIKQIKDNNSQLTEKHLKEKKQINNQFEIYRAERDKLKAQYSSRQKSLSQQLTTLRQKAQNQDRQESHLMKLKQELDLSEKERKQLTEKVNHLNQKIEELNKKNQLLSDDYKKQERQSLTLEQMLARERKQRSLMAVPSLEELHNNQQKTFNDIYAIVTQKESEINFLERQVSDLKQQLQGLKETNNAKLEAMEIEQNDYIQTIIDMKMRCAESEMKAAESQHLYSQLKKKYTSK